MPLNPVRHNRLALTIVKNCLNELLWDALGRPAQIPNGMLGMLPVYSIPLKRLMRGQYHRSWRSGWRYFWLPVDGDAGAVVDIVRTMAGNAELGYFSYGNSATRLTQKLERAESRYGEDAIRFRPRILSLGLVQMEALWLNERGPGRENVFESLLPLSDESGFVATALDRHRKRVSAQISRLRAP